MRRIGRRVVRAVEKKDSLHGIHFGLSLRDVEGEGRV